MQQPQQDPFIRRQFLQRSSLGLGAAAVASLASDGALFASPASSAAGPHFAPTARRIIYLFMSGGPSQLDLFDRKPGLHKLHGTELPKSVIGKQRLTTMTRGQAKLLVAADRQKWQRFGESGQEMNAEFRHLGQHADQMAIIRSVHTEPINHDPAVTFMQTGSPNSGRPAMGAWMSYGLGPENCDLPEFVVLLSNGGQPVPSRYWQNGFLPSRHQGVQFQSKGDPVLFLSDPKGMDRTNRGRMVDYISRLNRLKHEQVKDPEIEARIDAYQLAYRMQASVPALTDLTTESKQTLEMYGANPGQPSFAANCLLARRLAESGVRFVQLYDRGWDHHSDTTSNVQNKIRQTEKSCAALLTDLKERGLLDDTLVIWGGEFGRTTYGQDRGKTYGRDHHPGCFSMWMAGGGIRGGVNYGRTDDFSYNVAENGVTPHDLQATILHCMGLDHKQLTYRFKGRDFRLTDVAGNVVGEILG